METNDDWATVSQIDCGKAATGELRVMLKFHLQVHPEPPGTPPQPAPPTPALYLTELQARHLVLLIGGALGLPGSDIPGTPARTLQ